MLSVVVMINPQQLPPPPPCIVAAFDACTLRRLCLRLPRFAHAWLWEFLVCVFCLFCCWLPQSVDMWSVGVIIYTLLGGYPPFHDENQTRLFRRIKAGSFKFHDEYWSTTSVEAKVCVRACVCNLFCWCGVVEMEVSVLKLSCLRLVNFSQTDMTRRNIQIYLFVVYFLQ